MQKVLIAYSGGVDSALLAKVAYDTLGKDARCITVIAPMHPKNEMDDAKELAKEIGIEQDIFLAGKEAIKEIEYNPENRCYLCKKSIFSKLIEEAGKLNIKYIVDGSNEDDKKAYRPGKKALEELSVRSPLAEAGLTKDEIRELSKKLNLRTHDKPSFSCLVTRFPYGEQLTAEKLQRVELGEAYLKEIGFKQYRVREHKDIVRIELGRDERKKAFSEEVLDKVDEQFRKIGYKYVTLEARGFVSGSMDVNIKEK